MTRLKLYFQAVSAFSAWYPIKPGCCAILCLVFSSVFQMFSRAEPELARSAGNFQEKCGHAISQLLCFLLCVCNALLCFAMFWVCFAMIYNAFILFCGVFDMFGNLHDYQLLSPLQPHMISSIGQSSVLCSHRKHNKT